MDYVDRTKMKYLAAYLLLTAAGNTTPSSEDIKSVLSSVGIETSDKDVASLLSAVEGKDINEVKIKLLTFWQHVKDENHQQITFSKLVDCWG